MGNDGIKNLLLQINKKHGEGSAIFGDEAPLVNSISSSGSYKLDNVFGCGGIPEGRVIELYGAPSGGKTTLSLTMIKEVQKAGHIVGFVDVEQAFDPVWAERLGVNLKQLIFAQPSSGEEALDVALQMANSGEVKFIVLDSVAALATKAMLEGEIGDAHMAQVARLMSQSLPVIVPVLSEKNVTMAFINQTRNKIGVMYGNPTTTTGGDALRFYASTRLEVSRGEVIGDKEDPEGFVLRAKAVKNKCGRPFLRMETNMYIGKDSRIGIDKQAELIDIAVENGIVKKAGSWFSYGEERLGQGIDTAINSIKQNSGMFEEIEKQVIETVFKKDYTKKDSFNAVMAETDNKKSKRKKVDSISEGSVLEEVE